VQHTMEKASRNRSPAAVVVTLVGLVFIALLSAVITVVVLQKYNPYQLCGRKPTGPQFGQDLRWSDDIDKVEIAEKNVMLMRDGVNDHCFIVPKKPVQRNREGAEVAKPFKVLPEALGKELVLYFAGPDALTICGDFDIYLAVEVDTPENSANRARRQAPNTTGAPAPATTAGGDAGGTTAAPQMFAAVPGAGGKSSLDMTYEERTPNCMDILLLCSESGAIGKVQSCYTWINGVMYMEQTCIAENKFKITMTKPPGRMLKIAQQQWRICLFRRKEGKRC